MSSYISPNNTKEEIISYQKLRTFIGIIGLLLPFVLVIGCYLLGGKEYSFQPSISHYYYSKLHIVFVCTLCVLGGFLITYKGKPKNVWESRCSNVAGYCALIVASIPTPLKGFLDNSQRQNQYITLPNEVSKEMGILHFGFAGLLFICFIIFCLYFFQQPDEPYNNQQQILKFERRKFLYRVCGRGIAISIIALFGFYLYEVIQKTTLWYYSTFCFETTSLLFFGTAWLIKGSAFWVKYPILKNFIRYYR